MQRGIRFLVLAGALLMALGLWFLALYVDVGLCFDACPPEAGLAQAVAARLAGAAPLTVLCAAPMALAWLLCLIQLARAGRRGALVTQVALALAPPLVAVVSLSVLYAGTGGQLLPTTWAAHSGWDAAFQGALALVLFWPLATFVATFALRRR